MFGFKKQPKSQEFWSWFSANAQSIKSNGRREVGTGAADLSNRFHQSYPDLVWEITPSDSGPWTFCVSADGNPNFFNKVRDAVATAPSIPGWQIVAFRQRGSLDAVIDMNGQKLGYDDLWCGARPDGQKARVTVFVRGLSVENEKQLLGASLVLLDNAIGEYDAVMKISDLSSASS